MKKVLVVRNDKIGDFILAWPSFAMLKQSMPEVHVTALVPSYTMSLAQICPWIDEVILDPTASGDKVAQRALIATLKAARFDASINLFSTTYNALLVWKAAIPYRLAPATKWAQVFYNHRIRQKRSQSAKPEFEYNLDLIRHFLQSHNVAPVEPSAPYLQFSAQQLTEQRAKLAQTLALDSNKPWVMVHAGTGGSANNLSFEQYVELLSGIEQDYQLIITAGPSELEQAQTLLALAEQRGIVGVIYAKNDGLADFSCSIACANLFIAGSTGPLHIAAAIDVLTIGFFPSKRSATPLRWQPINSAGRHLAFAPPTGGGAEQEMDLRGIDINQVLKRVNPWVAQHWS
ncbi:glycosyltransferase family 9 protein [Vibrio sp. SM6]|uniref:Glycosyltransferase family 9 protein n=1 Tax=Vibrio agarilyticus TaxID=2726741 RepID=A0A7X8YHH0_9VIBR|nr:glycosyltransferase family 9 protein [Vibrio agarilyticus]NLS13570.1 glycosyltransferase family 9 protein [Vibrio agarilyticus]